MSKIKFTIAGLALTVISIASAANAQQTTGQQPASGQTQSGTQTPGTQTPGGQGLGTQTPGQQNAGQQNPGQPGAGQVGRPAPPVQTPRDQQALNQQGPNSGSQSENQQSVSVEEALAKKIKKSNDAEIELAQLAQEKVDDQSFRQFTQMLIQDHQQMNEQLEKFVSTTGGRSGQDSTTRGSATQGSTDRAPAGQGAASGNSAGQSGDGQNASGQNAAGQSGRNTTGQARQDSQPQSGTTSRLSDGQGQAAGMAGGGVPQMLCTIMDEACDNNLEMTKQMLQEHEGQDFKMAFIGHQIVAHTASLAEMKAIQSSGPAQLKQLAQQATPKIEEHLDMAKKMAKKFEDDRTSGEGSSKSKSDDSK